MSTPDASPVRNATCEGPDNPKAEIVLTWTKPRGQFRDVRITMNNMKHWLGREPVTKAIARPSPT